MVKIVEIIREIFYKNQKSGDKNFETCCKYADRSDWIVKFTAFTARWSGGICVSIAIIMFFVTGDLFTPTGNSVPGIDSKTIVGWIFLLVIDAVVILFGYFIEASFDGLSFVIFANIPMVATILNNFFVEFDELLNSKKLSSVQRKRILLNIVAMQLKYNK